MSRSRSGVALAATLVLSATVRPSPAGADELRSFSREELVRLTGLIDVSKLWVVATEVDTSPGLDSELNDDEEVGLPPGTLTWVEGEATSTPETTGGVVWSPGRFVLIGAERDRIFRGQLIGLDTPLRWQAERRRYEATVQLRLVETQTASSQPLGLALPVVATTTANGISPSNLELTASNTPVELTIWAEPANPRATHPVTIAMGPAAVFGGELTVEKQPLVIRASPERVQGFGLETAQLTLGGAEGAGEASLSVSQGQLDGNRLESGESLRLRSSGLGSGTVTASLTGFQDAQVKVAYVFPFAFLLAAIGGGVFGAAIQWTALGGRKVKGAAAGLTFGTGALVGLLLCVAWAFGIRVVGLQLGSGFNEAAVFLIAAVGVAAGQGPLLRLLGLQRSPAPPAPSE